MVMSCCLLLEKGIALIDWVMIRLCALLREIYLPLVNLSCLFPEKEILARFRPWLGLQSMRRTLFPDQKAGEPWILNFEVLPVYQGFGMWPKASVCC